MKGLDTAIATRIAAGDTKIKVVHLLCLCVDESGNTQALYCMDKDVLVDVLHHTWTRVGFTLLCTVMQKEACGLSRGGKSGVSETFVYLDHTFDEVQRSLIGVCMVLCVCWCVYGVVCVGVCVCMYCVCWCAHGIVCVGVRMVLCVLVCVWYCVCWCVYVLCVLCCVCVCMCVCVVYACMCVLCVLCVCVCLCVYCLCI